jgi:hypothetical protein
MPASEGNEQSFTPKMMPSMDLGDRSSWYCLLDEVGKCFGCADPSAGGHDNASANATNGSKTYHRKASRRHRVRQPEKKLPLSNEKTKNSLAGLLREGLHIHRPRASLSGAGTRNSRRSPAPKPPGAQMLARNERPFEIPRLAPGFMMQTGIASRDEFEFFG